MITEYKSALYRISYQGVSMIENALGNPNLIQISVVLGCSIIVSPQQGGGIQYLPNGESRKWFLYGVNTKLNKTGRHFIYARLNRDGDQAYLIFSVNDYAIDGTINGENPSPAYYYVKVGEITETDTLEGATTQRKITFDFGKYQTDETREENYWQLRSDSQGNEYIITKYPVLTQGSLTQYATLDPVVPSIFEGIPYDNQTIWFNPATQRVEVIGGTGGGEAGSVKWVNITGKPTWIGDAKPTYNWSEIQGEKPFYTKEEIASKYVTIDTEQEITALKHFTAGLSVGESKKKIYEENGVVYIDADVAVTGAMTFYATAGRSVSTIMDAVTVDGITIKKENNVLKAVSGAGSSFDENAMWAALATSNSEKQIDKSHITTALTGYATESWVSQNYATASALASVSNKLNDFLEGSDTDNIINKWKELEAFLSGMAETDNLAEILETKADKKYVDSTFVTLATKQTITGEKTFSSVMNTAAIKASGAITAPSLAASDWVTIAGIKLRKLEDGALMLEGNLAVTGGITTYAIDPVSVSTVMDGVVVDGTTIKKENGKLVAVGGGEAGSVAWGNITGKPSVYATNIANITDLHSSWDAVLKAQKPNWLTAVSIATISDLHANWDALLKTAPSAYVTRWPTISEVTGKQNLIVKLNGGTTEGTNQFTYNATGAKTINITPAGIGAYTKSESDSKYPTKTGSGASGTWDIDINGTASDADKLDGYHEIDFFRARDYISYSVLENFVSRKSGTYNVGYSGYSGLLTVFYFGAGSTSAMEILAPYYDPSRGLQLRYVVDNNRFTSWRSFAFEDGNIYSATKLQTTRKLWGRPFDGTDDVIGDMTNVGWINNGLHIDAKDNNDTTVIYGSGHTFIFGDNRSYAHVSYRFRPNYGSQGPTQTSVHIENASAATNGNPTYTTTHYFRQDGAAYHRVALGVGREATNYGIFTNTIYASDWFRSEGSTGWVNQNYGGGWYMSDENFIRALGEKSVYLGNGSYRNAGGNSYYNNLENISEPYNCRYMSETTHGIPTGYIHPFCGWSDSAASGWATSYVIGSIRNYANNWGEMYFGIYQYEGARREWKAYMVLDGVNRQLYINGNLMVTGGGTFYGSDIRYKSIIQQIKLSLLDIAEAPSFVYRWNKKEMICDRFNIGGSAQYTKTILPWAVEEKNNLLTMDYATVAYTFAVHTARHLLTYESRTDKKIKKLEREIVILKKQLKKLGYEEVRTLDDQSV